MGSTAAKGQTSKNRKKTRDREDKKVLAEHGRFRPGRAESEFPDSGTESQAGFVSQWRQLVSPEEIIEAGGRLGVIKRQRKVDLVALAEATVSAMSPIPGAQTSAYVNYLALSGVQLAPSSFYDRFTPEFAALMKDLAGRAVAMVREVSQPGREIEELGTLLDHFDDVQAADSSCLMLKKFAKGWAPSTNKKRQAGVKLNTVIALTDQLPNAADITSQRQHDNKGLPEDTLEPNTLTFLDLGYIDIERFVDMTVRGAFFLTRLKTTHNPTIKPVHIGGGSRCEARGMKLDDALANECLGFQNGKIDIDIVLRHGKTEKWSAA
jgi:hypothetical protein